MATNATQDFSARLIQLMNEHNPPLDIRGLAEALDISYEHARKLVRREFIPSRGLLRSISDLFGANLQELKFLAEAIRFHKRAGGSAPKFLFDPEILPFANAWDLLSDDQKDNLLIQLNSYVSDNLKKEDSGSARP